MLRIAGHATAWWSDPMCVTDPCFGPPSICSTFYAPYGIPMLSTRFVSDPAACRPSVSLSIKYLSFPCDSLPSCRHRIESEDTLSGRRTEVPNLTCCGEGPRARPFELCPIHC